MITPVQLGNTQQNNSLIASMFGSASNAIANATNNFVQAGRFQMQDRRAMEQAFLREREFQTQFDQRKAENIDKNFQMERDRLEQMFRDRRNFGRSVDVDNRNYDRTVKVQDRYFGLKRQLTGSQIRENEAQAERERAQIRAYERQIRETDENKTLSEKERAEQIRVNNEARKSVEGYLDPLTQNIGGYDPNKIFGQESSVPSTPTNLMDVFNPKQDTRFNFGAENIQSEPAFKSPPVEVPLTETEDFATLGGSAAGLQAAQSKLELQQGFKNAPTQTSGDTVKAKKAEFAEQKKANEARLTEIKKAKELIPEKFDKGFAANFADFESYEKALKSEKPKYDLETGKQKDTYDKNISMQDRRAYFNLLKEEKIALENQKRYVFGEITDEGQSGGAKPSATEQDLQEFISKFRKPTPSSGY